MENDTAASPGVGVGTIVLLVGYIPANTLSLYTIPSPYDIPWAPPGCDSLGSYCRVSHHRCPSPPDTPSSRRGWRAGGGADPMENAPPIPCRNDGPTPPSSPPSPPNRSIGGICPRTRGTLSTCRAHMLCCSGRWHRVRTGGPRRVPVAPVVLGPQDQTQRTEDLGAAAGGARAAGYRTVPPREPGDATLSNLEKLTK